MRAAHLELDEPVDVREAVRRKDYDLAELLNGITPANLHEAVDFGGPAGKEAL